MPTYEYQCQACGHKFEEFQSIKAKPTTVCPKCKKKKVKRLISAGAGFIFKGSGFYITDYRGEAYKADAKNDAPKTDPPKTDTTKTETTKSDSKSTPASTPAKTESKPTPTPSTSPQTAPKPPKK